MFPILFRKILIPIFSPFVYSLDPSYHFGSSRVLGLVLGTEKFCEPNFWCWLLTVGMIRIIDTDDIRQFFSSFPLKFLLVPSLQIQCVDCLKIISVVLTFSTRSSDRCFTRLTIISVSIDIFRRFWSCTLECIRSCWILRWTSLHPINRKYRNHEIRKIQWISK